MITKENRAHGGPRPNSGRKSEGFRKKCAELAMSPKFFAFAKKVFDGEAVEERVAKDGGTIFIQASVGDRVYLWEKLAAYGFGKPANEVDFSEIAGPVQKLIDQNQALRIIQEMNFADRTGEADRGTAKLGNGNSEVQAKEAPTPRI